MATATDGLEAPVPRRASRLGLLFRSAVGKKALMALTGAVLFLYVLFHLLGNLQVFVGQERLDAYARLLHASELLLGLVRLVLLAALGIHLGLGVQLWLRARRARPVAYAVALRPEESSFSARTMIWSGVLILAFVVYHLLDLTVGVIHPGFREGQVFHNLLVSFGRASGVLAYLVALAALGLHLWHGVYSAFQSLGMGGRRFTPAARRGAAAVAVALSLGFASIPVAVLLGILR
ncbi:MAG TPA: succinate dehydrogenase cytochrome b subunit [Anaeromyxobacter sp.]|nr:succinate dehydrogenase cytochrome b subunit [Anaeromyxobacter sp.]